MSGDAFKMRIELAQLMRRHQVAPKPFTPIAPLINVEADSVSVEGLAAPASVDRERMMFGAHCWLPFRREIPLLFRHQPDRPAGTIQEIRSTDQGLFVRALISDDEAKRCPYFSVAATVHGYMLRNVDDPQRFFGLIGCASLDEISVTPDPVHPDALIRPTSAAVVFYDTAIRCVSVMQKMVQRIRRQTCQSAPASHRSSEGVMTGTSGEITGRSLEVTSCVAPKSAPLIQSPPCRPTPFQRLVQEMNR